jgi:A/G-specific adenine glycosylase
MSGFPTTGWDGTDLPAPLAAEWQTLGEVRHTFTHFHLTLTVMTATSQGNPQRGAFVPRAAFSPANLPTVFRKAWDLCAKG